MNLNFYFNTVASYVFSFFPYFQIASSIDTAAVVMEYGPNYIINMQIVLNEIPSGKTNVTLYSTYGDGSKSQHLKTNQNNTKASTMLKLVINVSDLWNKTEQEKNLKLFVDINYYNNTFCSTVYITELVYNYTLTHLSDSRSNSCFNTTQACTIKFSLNNTCRNLTDNYIESPMNSDEITSDSPRTSYQVNNKRECPVAESYIRNIINDKYHITADTDTICYKSTDVVTFSCNTTEDSNIQWLQAFGNNNNNEYYIQNKAVKNIVSSTLTLELLKLDHLSTLHCKATSNLQTRGSVTESKAFALINIDELCRDKPNEVSIDVDDTSVEISYLQSQVPFNHTCLSEFSGNYLALYYNGTTDLFHNTFKTFTKYNNIEAYCIGYEFSIIHSMQYVTNFTRIVFNIKKYAKQQHIRDNSAKLIIGIPAAIITGAVVCIVVWYITQLVKRSRQSRYENNGPDLVTYSTANEVQYAQLSVTQESSGIIRGQQEMTPYAEIIGVLEPKAKK